MSGEMVRISWASLALVALVALAALVASCGEKESHPSAGLADASIEAGPEEDASAIGPSDALDGGSEDAAAPVPRCPPDMVRVLDRFCVDRYETSLVDAETE